MREANNLDKYSSTAPLAGMLSRGSARTVVRVDATFIVADKGTIGSLEVYALLNNKYEDMSFGSVMNACASTHPACSVTATFWFDIDALEAISPGMFVGQPLNLQVIGSRLTGDSPGAPYSVTFSAQVVKKK